MPHIHDNIFETYMFYDQPIFFSVKDFPGYYRLVLLEDKDQSQGTETWLTVVIDRVRFNDMKANLIDLYTIFKEGSELGVCTLITTRHGQWSPEDVKTILSQTLTDDMLPLKGEYF